MILIKALLEDGRLSYRRLAKIAKVSTPTAEARIKRMLSTGFIRKISPIFDFEKVSQGVSAILRLKVDPSLINEFTSYLSSLDEVRNLFLTTGDSNLLLRVACSSTDELQSFLDTKIYNRAGISFVDSCVITKTIKDEQGFSIKPEIRIQLICDYCGGEIKGAPFKLRVGESVRYLCCKTCLEAYKEKYGSRISKLQKVSP